MGTEFESELRICFHYLYITLIAEFNQNLFFVVLFE